MTILELIVTLEKLMVEYGDIPVYKKHHSFGPPFLLLENRDISFEKEMEFSVLDVDNKRHPWYTFPTMIVID